MLLSFVLLKALLRRHIIISPSAYPLSMLPRKKGVGVNTPDVMAFLGERLNLTIEALMVVRHGKQYVRARVG